MQKYNKTIAQILQEMSITRAKEVAAELGDEAKEKGLEHMGHGVYGKNGKPEYRSNIEKQKLIKLTPDEIKDYMKKKSGDTDGDDEPKKDSPDTDKPKQDAPSKDTDSGPKVTSLRTNTGQLLQNPPHDSLPDKEQIGTDMRTVMGDRQPKVSYTQNGETIIHFQLKPFQYGPNEMAYSDVLSILEDDYGLVEGEDFVIDEISKEIDGEDMPSEIMVNIRRDPSASDSVEDEEAYDRERAQLARRGLFYRADSYNYVNEATVSVFDISYDDVPKSKLTQAARKFKIKMKKLPKNKVSFGGDDAIEFTGDEKNLLKFTKQQFGTTARNIRDLKKELEETAYPQISHSLIESIRNVVSEDPVQKAQDKLDKAKKIADLKKQIDTVKQEGQAYDNDRFLVRGNTAKVDNKNTKDTKDHVYAPNAKTAVAMKKKGVKQFLDTNKMRKMFPTYSEAVDSDDTGGAAEVDMIMNQVNQMRHFLDGIEKMVSDDGDVEEWVQGKITKATDYLKTAYSYKTGEKNEALDKEDEPAVKKLVKNLRKGSKTHAKQADELEKDLKDNYEPLEESPVQDFARKLAGYATKHGGIDKKDFMKIANKMVNAKNDGDIKKIGQQVDDMDTEPRDLIKGAIAIRMGAKTYQKMFGDRLRPSDIQQYKSMTPRYMKEDIDEKDVTNDMLITEFTSAQIKRLKKEYEPLRGVHHTELQPARFTQLSKMMQRMGKPQLQALVKADIPVLSSAAKASLVVNHGMKFSSIKEELIPYLEVFPLDENRKSKFKSVAPEVIDRIEKMMRGSREEKDSIANMLNYMMPPEVVDIVRHKLKIVPKRGKIKF